MAYHDAYVDIKPPLMHFDPSSLTNMPLNNSNSPLFKSAIPECSPEPIRMKTRPSSRGSGSEHLNLADEKETATGPHRSQSVSSGKSDKEKRKRSRVTPEQLIHLERFFTIDRSPTAARRREISDLLGMQERQTQIWFQNRRAKAKLQDGKQKIRSGSAEIPPESPPELSTGFEADLHNLIHENEPVTIIPCTDLTIGTWRRIATTIGKHDLVAYVCEAKRCLTWFIHSAGFGFKMEIPFETIASTDFTNAAPGSGLAVFDLSEPPIFYLENAASPRANNSSGRYWKRCSDWTEGHQATTVLRHELIGSAVQLSHVLQNLATNKVSEVSLRRPDYRPESSASPMEVPLPPMAGLIGPGYHYQPAALDSSPPEIPVLSRRHPTYGRTGVISDSPDSSYLDDDSRLPPFTAHGSNSLPHSQSYSAISRREAQASTNFDIPLYEECSQPLISHHSHDYTGIPISHGLAPRPYTAQPISRTFYNKQARQVSQPDNAEMRVRRSASADYHYLRPSVSPPLLTTPYHPPPHLIGAPNHSTSHLDHTPNYHSRV